MSFLAQPINIRDPMEIEAFRAFQANRSDDETWELIDGVPVMMTPTHLGHARIASNIEHLLSDALDAFDPRRMALQNIGVALGLEAETLSDLGRAARYAPQPDVAVIDDVFGSEERFATRLYVAVEVVSDTDNQSIPSRKMRWIEAKTRLYQAHRFCEAVVNIEQTRVEVRVSRRLSAGWRSEILTGWNDVFTLPSCGLACKVGDLYRRTPLDLDHPRLHI